MSKKAVTLTQLLESARQSEALITQVALAAEWELSKKQDALSSGDNIKIEKKDGKTVISAAGGAGAGGPINWADINGRPDLSTVSSMVVAPIILSSALWDESKQQTVPIEGILADENAQLIIPKPKYASVAAYNAAGVELVAQAEGTLTFQAKTIPAENLSVNVYVFGAAEVKEEYAGTFEWWSPQMTSYTTPAPYAVSPEIGGSIGGFGGLSWNAFEGVDDKGWFQQKYDVDATYIQFDAGSSVLINGISFRGFLYSGEIYVPASFKLKGSNDEENWDLLAEIDAQHILETQKFEFENSARYRYYRLTNIARYSNWISNAICNVQFYIFREVPNDT